MLVFKSKEVLKMLKPFADGEEVSLCADMGVYLFLMSDKNQPRTVTYAQGIAPGKLNWHEKQRAQVGGDDFVDHVGTVKSIRALCKMAPLIYAMVSENEISLGYFGSDKGKINARR